MINGFNRIDGNMIIFDYINEKVENIDVIAVLKDVQKVLKVMKTVENKPVDYYLELMINLLNVGVPYSSFVEILLCNMFLSELNKSKDLIEFWRYNQEKNIVFKLGHKTMASHLSKTLGCLYTPNKNTIRKIDGVNDSREKTIYEKIWFLDF
jgi:hypothetical protein